MRSWLTVLAILSVALGVLSLVLAYVAGSAGAAAQAVGSASPSGEITDSTFRRQQEYYSVVWTVSPLIAPLATAALFGLLAIVAVLARRWQLRGQSDGIPRQ